MKKRLTILLALNLFLIIAYSQDFDGVELRQNHNKTISIFEAKGYKYLSTNYLNDPTTHDRIAIAQMKGVFNNLPINLYINYTYWTKEDGLNSCVYEFIVEFPEQKTWPSLEEQYKNYKSKLEAKYGSNELTTEMFSLSYAMQGGGNKMKAVKDGKCQYESWWTDKRLTLKISSSASVAICYGMYDGSVAKELYQEFYKDSLDNIFYKNKAIELNNGCVGLPTFDKVKIEKSRDGEDGNKHDVLVLDCKVNTHCPFTEGGFIISKDKNGSIVDNIKYPFLKETIRASYNDVQNFTRVIVDITDSTKFCEDSIYYIRCFAKNKNGLSYSSAFDYRIPVFRESTKDKIKHFEDSLISLPNSEKIALADRYVKKIVVNVNKESELHSTYKIKVNVFTNPAIGKACNLDFIQNSRQAGAKADWGLIIDTSENLDFSNSFVYKLGGTFRSNNNVNSEEIEIGNFYKNNNIEPKRGENRLREQKIDNYHYRVFGVNFDPNKVYYLKVFVVIRNKDDESYNKINLSDPIPIILKEIIN